MIGLASDQVDASGDFQRVSAILDAAPSGGDYPFVTSWAEFNDLNPGVNSIDIRSLTGNVTSTAADIIPPPSTGRQRQVKFISIRNTDSASNVVNVTVDSSSSSAAFVIRINLAPGEHLQYTDGRGWYVLDVNGRLKTSVSDVTPGYQVLTRIPLSGGSANGRPIAVAATVSPGTILHTASLGDLDDIWIWINNRTAAAATLTIEWGGTGTSDQITQALSIPANSAPILIIPGIELTGGLVVRAFSGTANALNASGYVNRLDNA